MKINKILTVAAVLSISAMTSCEDWLDINHSPNSPEKVPAVSLLPGVEIATAYNSMTFDYLTNVGIYNQYFTQSSGSDFFLSVEEFDPEDASNSYLNYYSKILNNAQALLKSQDDNSPYKMIAELISIYAWQNVVDTWGDVPYSEALQAPEIINPHFDKAEDIYKDLVSRINAVIANYESGKYTGVVNYLYEPIFSGEIENWALFANSLKLKLMLRYVNSSDYNNDEVLTFVKEHKFLTEFSAQLDKSIWGSQKGKYYPADEFENDMQLFTNYLVASRTIVNYLDKNSDPRLAKYFTKVKNADGDDYFYGKPQNSFITRKNDGEAQGKVSKLNFKTLVRNIPLISNWETNFNIAEVYLRAGDDAMANEHYTKGVIENLEYWSISDNSIVDVDGYAKWDEGQDLNSGLKQISMQRWLSFYMTQHAEAFFERQRLGYPQVSMADPSKFAVDPSDPDETFPTGYFTIGLDGSALPEGVMPSSFVYPLDNCLSLNTNAPAQKPDMTVKLFWHLKD